MASQQGKHPRGDLFVCLSLKSTPHSLRQHEIGLDNQHSFMQPAILKH